MIETKYTLTHVIDHTEPADPKWRQAARDHIEKLAIPPWSLGQLLVVAEQLAGIQRTIRPNVDKNRSSPWPEITVWWPKGFLPSLRR